MKLVPMAVVAAILSLPAAAEEGMWTFDNPPRGAIEQKYGVKLDAAWLDHVRRIDRAPRDGLHRVLHLGRRPDPHQPPLRRGMRRAEFPPRARTSSASGFLAGTREQELKCEEDAISVLVGTEDVTAKVAAAVQGIAPSGLVEARRAALTKLEQACEEQSSEGEGRPAQVRARHALPGRPVLDLQVPRYEDVRLVFAPERDIAAFGGDPDNFQFPRWCLDMSILRVYENGKPAKTPIHLRFDWAGAQPGDAVFVSGHPGDYGSPADGLRSSNCSATRTCRSGCCATPSCAAA